jgi:hypothetical protein
MRAITNPGQSVGDRSARLAGNQSAGRLRRYCHLNETETLTLAAKRGLEPYPAAMFDPRMQSRYLDWERCDER